MPLFGESYGQIGMLFTNAITFQEPTAGTTSG